MQRTYEVMFIVRPDILDEDLDKLIAGLEGDVYKRQAPYVSFSL